MPLASAKRGSRTLFSAGFALESLEPRQPVLRAQAARTVQPDATQLLRAQDVAQPLA